MSDSAAEQSKCQNELDEILAATCEARPLLPAVASHIESCASCREAKSQIDDASPEVLALLVVMRGISGGIE